MAKRGEQRPRAPVGNPSLHDGLPHQAALYVAWMRARNFSPATIDGRQWRLRLFIDWCAERDLWRAREITPKILAFYQTYLYRYRKTRDDKPLSFRTQYLHLSTVALFFRWLKKTKLLGENPAEDLELPRQPKQLPRTILTPFEVEQVMAQINLNHWVGLRDRAILETFYGTGIRRNELIHIRLYDFDLDKLTLFVRQGKGGRDRVVPIGKRTAFWLEQYLTEQRPRLLKGPDPGYFFLTQDGTRMGKGVLSRLVHGYIARAALGKDGSCHIFRHSMATAMLEAGADTRYIQQMLGHADLKSTQMYTHVTIQKLKEVYMATHPGEAMQNHTYRKETVDQERDATTRQ